jgi:hypothetical protein
LVHELVVKLSGILLYFVVVIYILQDLISGQEVLGSTDEWFVAGVHLIFVLLLESTVVLGYTCGDIFVIRFGIIVLRVDRASVIQEETLLGVKCS